MADEVSATIVLTREEALPVYGAALEAVAHGTEPHVDVPHTLGEEWLNVRCQRIARKINPLTRSALPAGWGWRVTRAVRP